MKLPLRRIDWGRSTKVLYGCVEGGNKNECDEPEHFALCRYGGKKGVRQNARSANRFQGPTNDSKAFCVSNPYLNMEVHLFGV
jgi:hypothetical protein